MGGVTVNWIPADGGRHVHSPSQSGDDDVDSHTGWRPNTAEGNHQSTGLSRPLKLNEGPVTKRFRVPLIAAAVWALVMLIAILKSLPWPSVTNPFSALTIGVTLTWSFVLLWSMHHLAYQLWSMLGPQPTTVGEARRAGQAVETDVVTPLPPRIKVAILYTTCNDFNEGSCKALLRQDYENYTLFVLDDSDSDQYVSKVKEFCDMYRDQCKRIERVGRQGYKAGNLNHALNEIDEIRDAEYFLLADADQGLTDPSFLKRLIAAMLKGSSSVPFVQAANMSEKTPGVIGMSHFEQLMSLSIDFFYRRDLPIRVTDGFVPMLGHGALVRRSAWEEVHGFPEIVSEDLGFALRCARYGHPGTYVEEPWTIERFPYDFGGFTLRLRKYAAGTAELIRREVLSFLQKDSHARLSEKWDAVMQVAWYPLMPVMVLNGFLTAYLLHHFWKLHRPYLHAMLPALYLLMTLLLFILLTSVANGNLGRAADFFFWSSAIHIAAMPVVGAAFLHQVLRRGPARFHVTPKNGEKGVIRKRDSLLAAAVGSGALIAAFGWGSPYSPILVAHGIAFVSYWLYGSLNSEKLIGAVARKCIYLPGIFLLYGLYTVWEGIGISWLPIPWAWWT